MENLPFDKGIFEKLSDPSSTYTNKIDFGASSLEKK